MGVKIVRRIPGGIVQAGGGMMIEPDAVERRRSVTRPPPSTTGQDGRLKDVRSAARGFGGFPGYA